MAINSKDLKLLVTLGMHCVSGQNCDFKSPVSEITEDTQAPAGTKNPEQYTTAFANFARLFGDSKKITADDLKELRRSPEKLADLLENDPSMEPITHSRAAFVMGKKSIDNRVTPRSQRRMIGYIQMALNEIYSAEIKSGKMSALSIDGDLGETTRARVEHFQNQWRRTQGDRGMVIGPDTIAQIIFRLRHSKQDICEALERSGKELAGTKGFVMEYLYPEGSAERRAQEALWLALQEMGVISMYQLPDRRKNLHIVYHHMKNVYGAERIGRVVLGLVGKDLSNL